MLAEFAETIGLDVLVVEEDLTEVWVVEAEEEAGDGAFAGSELTDERY